MARLIYSVIASHDGFVADENGNFDWAAPDDELLDEHRFESGVVHLHYRTAT